MNIFDPVLISLVRKNMPNVIAEDVLKVQPMVNPFSKIEYPYRCDALTFSKYSNLIPIKQWCKDSFKEGEWDSNAQFFAFKKEEDYLWFLLKWS